MDIPDSHTSIFTRIPTRIDKTWSVRTHECTMSGAVTDPDIRHSKSLIRSIQVSIEFDVEDIFDIDELTEVQDTKTDGIPVWQEARRDWATLESAVTTMIKGINERNWSRAHETKLKTVDMLNCIRTRPQFKMSRPLGPASILKTGSSRVGASTLIGRRVQTIHPLESASVTGMDQMRELLEEMIRDNNAKEKQKKSKSGSHVKVRRRA